MQAIIHIWVSILENLLIYFIFADRKIVPFQNHGVKCMSIGFLVPKDSPLVWRGPMVCICLTVSPSHFPFFFLLHGKCYFPNISANHMS